LNSLIKKIPSTQIIKSQNTNTKQITMTQIQNLNVLVLENWNLRFIWNLVLEIWDLIEFIFKKAD
jgi:hypothetical protein